MHAHVSLGSAPPPPAERYACIYGREGECQRRNVVKTTSLSPS